MEPETIKPQNSDTVTSLQSLVEKIDKCCSENRDWEARKNELYNALNSVDLSNEDISSYVYFNPECPYTRNLVATDNENYTLLMLCWKKGGESKIHNHPCDGCFIKPLIGCVRESIYKTCLETNSIIPTEERYYCEGEVSFMSDNLGLLHKVGNASSDIGAITLHLYCRPFNTCKVWNTYGVGTYDRFEQVSLCYKNSAPNTPTKSKCEAATALLDESTPLCTPFSATLCTPLSPASLWPCNVEPCNDTTVACRIPKIQSLQSSTPTTPPTLSTPLLSTLPTSSTPAYTLLHPTTPTTPTTPVVHPSVEVQLEEPNGLLFPSYIRSGV